MVPADRQRPRAQPRQTETARADERENRGDETHKRRHGVTVPRASRTNNQLVTMRTRLGRTEHCWSYVILKEAPTVILSEAPAVILSEARDRFLPRLFNCW